MMMRIDVAYRNSRHKRAVDYAIEFLANENITCFPIDPFAIIKRNKWKLRTYTQLAKKLSIANPSPCLFCSKDALVSKNKNSQQYLIAFNETVRSKGRINFSLMHEVGHIVLGHLEDFPCINLARNGLSNREYNALEAEANCFAANVLAPAILVKQFGSTLPSQTCQRIFGISKEAWEMRLELASYDYNLLGTNKRESQKLQYRNFVTIRECNCCGKRIIGLHKYTYCPFCKSKQLKWRRDLMKYPDIYILDDSGRPKECPICKNEDLLEGEFCKICGSPIINRCTNIADNPYDDSCGIFADGNARYCIQCGHPTSYFSTGMLQPWNGISKQKQP